MQKSQRSLHRVETLALSRFLRTAFQLYMVDGVVGNAQAERQQESIT
ncbi:hypothetical protein [Brevibacillus sp. 1238]|nr:hypothetical protein [Brevibacillus sp. 1238]MDH6352571.1 hypothetical protein [Brevibacillus sp. 1238]